MICKMKKYSKAYWTRLLIYIAKCITGVGLVYVLSWLINYHETIWCLISVMLVLSPDGNDAVSLAVNRIKANAVGAAVGFLVLIIFTSNMYGTTAIYGMALGVAVTAFACTLLNLEPATRTALAATIIILTHEPGRHVWDTAVERLIAVMVGCVMGLLITFIFHSRFLNRPVNVDHGAD